MTPEDTMGLYSSEPTGALVSLSRQRELRLDMELTPAFRLAGSSMLRS